MFWMKKKHFSRMMKKIFFTHLLIYPYNQPTITYVFIQRRNKYKCVKSKIRKSSYIY